MNTNITRYKIDVTHYRYISDAKLKEAQDGDVVKFTDHESIVADLQDQIARLNDKLDSANEEIDYLNQPNKDIY